LTQQTILRRSTATGYRRRSAEGRKALPNGMAEGHAMHANWFFQMERYRTGAVAASGLDETRSSTVSRRLNSKSRIGWRDRGSRKRGRERRYVTDYRKGDRCHGFWKKQGQKG